MTIKKIKKNCMNMMLQIKHAFELAQLYLHANFKKNIKK